MKTAPLKLVGTLIASLAVAFALAGCGNTPAEESSFAENFEGTWVLVGTQGDTAEDSDLAVAASSSAALTLQLDADGAAQMDLPGGPATGKWAAKTATEGTFEGDGLSGTLTLKDVQLSFDDGKGVFLFEREAPGSEEPEDAAAAGEGFVGKWVWEEKGAPPANLELKEDGTGLYTHVGTADEGTWEATTATAGTFNGGAFVAEMTLDGDTLTLHHHGNDTVYQRK